MLKQFFARIKALFIKDLNKLKTDLSGLVTHAESLEKHYATMIAGYTKIISIANLRLDAAKAEQATVTKLKTDIKAIVG